MEELKKENVVVSLVGIDPNKVLAVLDMANEKICNVTREYAAEGCLSVDRHFFFDGKHWQTKGGFLGESVTISLDQLASMFGQYKYQIGDTVKCVENATTKQKVPGYGWEKGLEFTIYDIRSGCCFNPSGHGVYPEWLQLVEKADKAIEEVAEVKVKKEKPNPKPVKVPERTISREALSEIYNTVCPTWQQHINRLLGNSTFKFLDALPVSEEFIKSAYEASSQIIHEEWLKKYLPPLKIKKEVEITKWCLVDPQTLKVLNSFVSYQAADDHESLPEYKGSKVVELKGTMIIEEDDPDYDFLPF